MGVNAATPRILLKSHKLIVAALVANAVLSRNRRLKAAELLATERLAIGAGKDHKADPSLPLRTSPAPFGNACAHLEGDKSRSAHASNTTQIVKELIPEVARVRLPRLPLGAAAIPETNGTRITQ
jgi:hypothetical protein